MLVTALAKKPRTTQKKTQPNLTLQTPTLFSEACLCSPTGTHHTEAWGTHSQQGSQAAGITTCPPALRQGVGSQPGRWVSQWTLHTGPPPGSTLLLSTPSCQKSFSPYKWGLLQLSRSSHLRQISKVPLTLLQKLPSLQAAPALTAGSLLSEPGVTWLLSSPLPFNHLRVGGNSWAPPAAGGGRKRELCLPIQQPLIPGLLPKRPGGSM